MKDPEDKIIVHCWSLMVRCRLLI